MSMFKKENISNGVNKKFLYIFLIVIIGIIVFVPGKDVKAEGEGIPTLDCPIDSASEGDTINLNSIGGNVRNNGDKDDIRLYVQYNTVSSETKGIICIKEAKLDTGASVSCSGSGSFEMPDESVQILAIGYHKVGGSWEEDTRDEKWITLIGGPAPPPGEEIECPPGSICISNPIKADTFAELIDNIIDFIFNIALLIAPIMFIIAGFSYITAAGDPAKIKKSGDIVIWTGIGLIVVLLSKGIIQVIQDIF